MRLTSKLLGAGIIVTSTALAGCNCCDSGNRQMASKQTPTSSQQMAYGQRPAAGRTTWGSPGGQSQNQQVVQTSATGQPGSGVQQAGWSNAPAGMNSQNTPAIPVTPTQTTPGYGAAGYGSPITTGAYSNSRSAAPTGGYGTTPGAYSAPAAPKNLNLGGQPISPMTTTPSSGMSTGSPASTTSTPSTGMGSGGAMAPSATTPVAGMGGSSLTASTASPGGSQIITVPGSSAGGQPATAATDPSASPLSGGSSSSSTAVSPVSATKGGLSN